MVWESGSEIVKCLIDAGRISGAEGYVKALLQKFSGGGKTDSGAAAGDDANGCIG